MKWVLLAAGLLAGCGPRSATILISVAASLQPAMTELLPLYQRTHPGVRVSANYGGSGALAQQILHGAPVDVFFSAAPKPMDMLAAKGLLVGGTRRNVLSNRIVLVANPPIDSFAALSRAKVIAMGEPESVPAGDYARQALTHLGLWDNLRSKMVFAKDVRQVLSYVETGNADAGIVYATDARGARIAAFAPEGSHEAVVYPLAVVKDSREARAFASFLAGPKARTVFTRYGFTSVLP